MSLLLIFAIAGVLGLLSALFGGGTELGPVTFPKLPGWARLSAGILGILLIGISLWAWWRFVSPAATAAVEPASTPALAPAALSGVAVPQAAPVGGQAPVILGIQTSLMANFAGAFVLAEIHFQDADGDVYEVAYTVIASSVPGVVVQPELITASPQEQKAGTVQTLEWSCQGSGVIVALKAVILDKAGHRSSLVPFVLDCG